jgi:hypothetical protein
VQLTILHFEQIEDIFYGTEGVLFFHNENKMGEEQKIDVKLRSKHKIAEKGISMVFPEICMDLMIFPNWWMHLCLGPL